MSTLQTLDRGLAAIEIVSRHTGGVTPTELADQLGVHRAGAYRILETLEQRRLVAKGADGRYRLGTGTLVVAARFMQHYRTAAQPIVQRLADDSGCTAFVAIADRGDAVAIAVAEPTAPDSIGISYQVGARHPLAVGADGIAILAARPERGDDPESVIEARRRGYAISDGQVQSGAVGLAMGTAAEVAGHVESSVGVIRLGRPGDLEVERVLPTVQGARDALRERF